MPLIDGYVRHNEISIPIQGANPLSNAVKEEVYSSTIGGLLSSATGGLTGANTITGSLPSLRGADMSKWKQDAPAKGFDLTSTIYAEIISTTGKLAYKFMIPLALFYFSVLISRI